MSGELIGSFKKTKGEYVQVCVGEYHATPVIDIRVAANSHKRTLGQSEISECLAPDQSSDDGS